MPNFLPSVPWHVLHTVFTSPVSANVLASLALAVSVLSAWFTQQQANSAQEANSLVKQEQASDVYIEVVDPREPEPRYVITNRNPKPAVNAYYTFKIGDRTGEAQVDVGLLPGCSSVPLTPLAKENEQIGFEPISLFYRDQNGLFWRRDYNQGITQLQRDRTVPSSSTIAVDILKIAECP